MHACNHVCVCVQKCVAQFCFCCLLPCYKRDSVWHHLSLCEWFKVGGGVCGMPIEGVQKEEGSKVTSQGVVLVLRAQAGRLLYLAVRQPGCVLRSCGWKNCAYLRTRPADWAAMAAGRQAGRMGVAPLAQRPPRTTSSEREQSPPVPPSTTRLHPWEEAEKRRLRRKSLQLCSFFRNCSYVPSSCLSVVTFPSSSQVVALLMI